MAPKKKKILRLRIERMPTSFRITRRAAVDYRYKAIVSGASNIPVRCDSLAWDQHAAISFIEGNVRKAK